MKIGLLAVERWVQYMRRFSRMLVMRWFKIDTWQEHVDAINKNGLRVEGASV